MRQVHFTTSYIGRWDFVMIFGTLAKNPAKIKFWLYFNHGLHPWL